MNILVILLFATAVAAQPGRHITGVVVEGATQAPVFGAVISEPAGKRLAVTDKAGRFQVTATKLPPSLQVSAPNLAPRNVDVPASGASLDLGKVFLWKAARVALSIAPTIIGDHLRWSLGMAQSGARTVEVKREGKLPIGQPELVLDALEPGQYLFEIIGERPLQHYALPIRVEAGADIAVPVAFVPVTVDLEILKGDKPLPNARIEFRSYDFFWQGDVQCDDQGRATEELWQRGKYVLLGLSKGKLTHGEYQTLTGDGDRIHVQMRMPAHTITGRVLDAETDAPLGNTNVLLTEPGGNTHGAKTDSSGNFEFESVPEGVHALKAYKKGYRYDRPFKVEIRPEDGDVDNTVRLEPMVGARHVRVIDTAGAPIIGANVFFGAGVQATPLESTDESGSVDVPPGSGTLYVVPQSGSFAFRKIRSDDVDAMTLTVLPPTGLLTITSESTKHEPIPNVYFIMRVNGTLIPPAVASRLATIQHVPFRTDADGRAQLSGLPAGLYEVWPTRGRAELDAVFSGNPGAPAASVPVSAVPQSVTLTFQPVSH